MGKLEPVSAPALEPWKVCARLRDGNVRKMRAVRAALQ
jgi:hypothetical protein